MGCHTWFKTKSRYSIEDLRKIFLEQYAKWIEKWKVYTNDPSNSTRIKIFDHLTQDQFELYLKTYERQLRMVKNSNIKWQFIYHLNDTDEGKLYEYHNDIVYVETEDMPHDIFRIGGYPQDILLSLRQTLHYCEENNIKLTTDQKQKLEDFWNRNPIGHIHFG